METPEEALTVVVPESVPPPGFVPIATAIDAVDVVTVLPRASVTATVTAGEIDVPAVAVVGCWTNASFDAAPAEMLNVELVALVSAPDEALSVYPVPDLLIERPEKVATPLTALTVAVPESVPPPGFVAIATVIDADEVVTVFPPASWTATVTDGLIDAPATAFDGFWTNASWVAAPTVILNVELVALVRPVEVAVSV